MSIFEAVMLLCFGFAWPFSIYTSFKSKTAKGKSILFLLVLLIGYLAGITHKILYSFDYIIALYILNFCFVFIDTILYFRNRKYDQSEEIKK
ncbi:MAG: hypothetical protein GX351_01465 [Peptococcaceae bacterium]|nr:hypothetical protein [Peptococcaceae bacterium]